MHTADRSTLLGEICDEVARMKPGECLTVGRYILRDIPTFFHNDANFAPEDRVLGNIIGAAYTHSYTVNLMTGDVTFRRHDKTGHRYYSDPDRR